MQVPDAGPIKSVEALAGKRIVTSFEVLAGHFFKDIDDRAGLVGDAGTSVEYVGGSVEAACALGLADAIGTCIFFSINTKLFQQKILKFPQQLTSWVSI